MTLDQPSLRAAAERGALWSVIGRWGAQAAAVITLVIVARNVSKDDVGLAAVTLSVLMLLQVLADAGIGTYLIQSGRRDQRTLSTAFWTTAVLTLLLAALLVGSRFLLERLLGVPGVAKTVPWIALSLLALGASVVPTALLEQQLRFKSLATRQLFGTLAGSVVAVALALHGAGVWAIVVQSIVQNSMSAVVVFAAARWRPSLAVDRAHLAEMVSFGSQSAAISVLTQLRDRLDDFLLGAFLGAAAVGSWSMATRTTRLLTDVTNSVVQAVSLPLLARISGDRARMDRGFSRLLGVSLAVLTPALALVAMLSPDLFTVVLGQQWQSAVLPSQLIAVSSMVASLSSYDRTFYLAVGRPSIELRMTIVLILIAVGITIVSAPHGPVVLALAALVRTAVFVPVRVVIMMRSCQVRYAVFREPVLTILAASSTAGAVYAFAQISMPEGIARAAVKALLFLPLYVAVLRVLARITFADVFSSVGNFASRARPRVATAAGPE